MVNDKRAGHRISCVSKCLVYHNGSKYPGILENVSISGALVSMTNSLQYVIQLGDTCSLVFCGDRTLCPDEHLGKVVRLNSPQIGLQFLEEKTNEWSV